MKKGGKNISVIWSRKPDSGILEAVSNIIEQARQQQGGVRVFFRADDIGRVDDRFCRLMQIFQEKNVPLCLAIVPQWMNTMEWRQMQQFTPAAPLWCWHQHGWSHVNHEPAGKKSEFGPSRTREQIRNDLSTGRSRLETILGGLFLPVFTPPWNRCSVETLELLEELKFQAVSRSKNAKPPYSGSIRDLAVNVDLHTRRETDFQQGWQNLLAELKTAAQSGTIGVMLHHQLMNDAAYQFLSNLIGQFNRHRNIACCTFRELF